MRICNAAKALEQGCIRQLAAEEIKPLLKSTVAALEIVLNGLSQCPDRDEQAATPANQLSDADARSLFGQLRKLLEQDDTAAIEAVNRLRGAQNMLRHAATLEMLVAAASTSISSIRHCSIGMNSTFEYSRMGEQSCRALYCSHRTIV